MSVSNGTDIRLMSIAHLMNFQDFLALNSCFGQCHQLVPCWERSSVKLRDRSIFGITIWVVLLAVMIFEREFFTLMLKKSLPVYAYDDLTRGSRMQKVRVNNAGILSV